MLSLVSHWVNAAGVTTFTLKSISAVVEAAVLGALAGVDAGVVGVKSKVFVTPGWA